jgi:hypothetical protein
MTCINHYNEYDETCASCLTNETGMQQYIAQMRAAIQNVGPKKAQFKPFNNGSQISVQITDGTSNPGQTILDRLTKLENELAALKALIGEKK